MPSPKASAWIAIMIAPVAASAQPCVVHVTSLIDPLGDAQNGLGWSAAVSVDVAIAGSPWDHDFAFLGGSASIFRKVSGVWAFDAKIAPAGLLEGDNFGHAVALLPTVAVVGARGDDQIALNAGAAYVFRHDGNSWIEEAKLLAPDAEANDSFGFAVAISADRAVVGSPYDDANGVYSGSAHVFRRVAGVWVHETKLLPDDGAADNFFGWSVSISGTSVAVGAFNAFGNAWGAGKVYVFFHDGSSWHQQAGIAASDGETAEGFGHAVSLFADVLLVGAPRDDDNGPNAGSAYVYRRSGNTWAEEIKLLPDTVSASTRYGHAVSVSGQLAAVSTGWTDEVYVHYDEPQDGQWPVIALKHAPGGHGHAVGASNDTIVAGTPGDDNVNGSDAGALLVYRLRDACAADYNRDCSLNTLDVLDFLNDWILDKPEADFNGDTAVNSLDVLAFLNAYALGCD